MIGYGMRNQIPGIPINPRPTGPTIARFGPPNLSAVRPMPSGPRMLGSFKKGGTVKRTGAYKLHKGEKVVPRSKARKVKLNNLMDY